MTDLCLKIDGLKYIKIVKIQDSILLLKKVLNPTLKSKFVLEYGCSIGISNIVLV